MATSKKKESQAFNAASSNQTAQRQFGDKSTFKSDLYKLEVAECTMNRSWNDIPNLDSVEHCHFFHTFDSSGKRMDRTNMVAGHFHAIEWRDNNDGKPAQIISVSGPMREVKRKIRGRFQKVIESVDAVLEDTHTHKVTYLRSEEIVTRQVSSQAVNIETQEAQKTAPVSGIQVG